MLPKSTKTIKYYQMGKYGIELEEIIGIKTPQTIAKELMERVRLRREQRGLSRAKLAELSGVKEPTIRYAEVTGKISLIHLLEIASVLDYTDEFKALFTTPRYRTIEEVIASNNPPRRGRKKKARE